MLTEGGITAAAYKASRTQRVRRRCAHYPIPSEAAPTQRLLYWFFAGRIEHTIPTSRLPRSGGCNA